MHVEWSALLVTLSEADRKDTKHGLSSRSIHNSEPLLEAWERLDRTCVGANQVVQLLDSNDVWPMSDVSFLGWTGWTLIRGDVVCPGIYEEQHVWPKVWTDPIHFSVCHRLESRSPSREQRRTKKGKSRHHIDIRHRPDIAPDITRCELSAPSLHTGTAKGSVEKWSVMSGRCLMSGFSFSSFVRLVGVVGGKPS